MSGIQQQLLGGPFGVAAYQIQRSLRFNSADSANLTRTPASASNRKTWTWSGWTKLSELKGQILFCCVGSQSDTSSLFIDFRSDATLRVTGWSIAFRQTTQVFRDFSAWYHIVVTIDTTQATANDRIKVYVNGSQITTFSVTNNPTQNSDLGINQASLHEIGKYTVGATGYDYYGGYITEMNFIDGQALTPSSFGETNADTGVWQPKQYTGTYGTNGFYLNFSDNSGTTSTTLGKDYSGNGNNWTPNNFSVTAGVGNDSLVDSPTAYGTDTGAGGEVRGNYATANPVDTNSDISLSNGNLQYTTSVTSWKQSRATISVPTTDKWYMEYTISAMNNSAYVLIGFSTQSSSLVTYPGGDSTGVGWQGSGDIWYSGNYNGSGFTFAQGDVVMFAIDRANQKVWIGKNGTWQNSGNPVAGTGNIANFSASTPTTGNFFPSVGVYSAGQTVFANFGQRPFAYTAPSGFKALVTQNLPTPTVVQGDDYFNTVLWTGNGASSRAITGVGFQPDWVWDKMRSDAYQHAIVDSVRGGNKVLHSNSSAAEDVNWTYGYVSSFDSDGFTIQAGSTSAENWNLNAATFVAWCWKANGTGSSNTQGTITSTVSANTTSGFSVVTYTGTGSSASVGHGLGAAPQMIIVKGRTNSVAWVVYSIGLTAGNEIYLNLTNAQASSANFGNAPTSTVFNLGSDTNANGSGVTYVAYCFAPVAGFSAFGSYTGNSNSDGPFIYLGFQPAWVMVKRRDASENWVIFDNTRDPYNLTSKVLLPNSSQAESSNTSSASMDLVSNGIKIRASTGINTGTWIYAAFAENPFKYSLAR